MQLQDLLIGSSPDGIVLFDPEFTITAWNPRMEQLFGAPAAAVLGGKLAESPVASLLLDRFPKDYGHTLAGKRSPFSGVYAPVGGVHHLLEITYFPLLDGVGDVAGGAASFRQVGGPNHLGTLSSRTYAQFHNVLEKMTDAFVALDGNWCYTYVNRKAAAIFNRTPEYLMGKHIWTEFPEGVGKPFHQAYYQAVTERVTITLEEYYPPYDKWFENRIFPLEDGLAIFFSDVTERRKEQGQLQASYAASEASQAQLRRVLDSLFIFAGLFSTDGILLYANAAPLAVGGLTHQDVLGKPLAETPWWTHSATERQKVRENLARAARGETVRFDTSIVDKEGKLVLLDVTFGPLYDEQGEVVQIIGSAVDITDRLAIQRQLNESNQRYQTLVDHFPNGAVFLFGHDLRFQVAGGTELSQVGLPKEMLLGKTVREVLPEEVASGLVPTYERTLAGESLVYEDEHGTEWYKVRTTPIRNAQREVVAGMVMAQNISREKHAEEQLKFYQFLVDHTHDPIYWISPGDNYRLSYVNQAACRHFGYPAEHLLTLSIPDWDPQFTWEDCERLDELIRQKKWIVFETQHRHSSGEVIPVEISATLLHYKGKEYYAGYIKDLRERKRVEAALRESEARYRHLFHANQDPLFLVDLQTRQIADVNPAGCRTYGYSREELLEMKKTDISAEPEQTLQAMRDQVSALTLRYHRKKDGTVFPVEMSFSHLFIDGREMGIAAARDITGRLEAEHRQQQLNQELIRQNEQLQQFSFITSHNLRAPVANLLGLLGLYDSNNPAAPENLAVVVNLERTVRRLDEVIYDLNELLVVRKGQDERQEVRFAQVLEQVLLSVGQQIEQSQAQLTANFAEVPAVFSVKSYVQSILLNLVSNAVKYRFPERLLRIQIETRREGPYVRLAVTDNGLGIDLHKHGERLFGLYRRLHPHLEGKGLGLHLVKTQIEALGGKVTVQSQPGQGSTFHVFFRES